MTVNAVSPLSDEELLRALANTGHDGVDELAGPGPTRAWWRGLHADHADRRVSAGTPHDVALLRSVRDLVRTAALRNNGVDVPVETKASPDLPLRFAWVDGPTLQPPEDATLPVQVAARAVLALLRASARPDWGRVKACPGPDCGWVFVDHSRNGARRWCQMSACGNRAKGAAFRERRRSGRA
jgi:predicted RNA-binding Zn ribbon-like protein